MNKHLLFIYFLIVLFIAFLVPVINVQGFLHPDDFEYQFFAETIANEGEYCAESRFNDVFSPSVAYADLNYIDEKICPTRHLGYSLILFPSVYIDSNFTFIVHSLLSLVGLVYLFLTVKKMMNNRTAYIVTIFMSMSFPFIYWSNVLIGNIVSFSLLIMGVYYYINFESSFKFKNMVLSSIFLAWAFLIRYEYLFVLFPFIILINYKYFKFNFSKVIPIMILFLIILFIIPILNYNIYGSPTTIGYDYLRVQDTINENMVNSNNAQNIEKGFFNDVYRLAIGHIMQAFTVTEWFVPNIYNYFIAPLGFILTLFILGMIFSYKQISKKFLFFHIFVLIIFIQLFAQGFHWGFNKNWVGTPYIRYLIPVFYIVFLFSGFALDRIMSYMKIKSLRIVLASMLLILMLTSTIYLLESPTGLFDTIHTMEKSHDINIFAESTEINSVFVTVMYSKSIFSRPLIVPSRINNSESLKIIEKLISEGRPLYFIQEYWHKNSFYDYDIILNMSLENCTIPNYEDVYCKKIIPNFE